MRKAFHIGGNSSCCAHIWQHYELYKKRCKDGNIPENHHTMPRVLWKELQEKKKGMHQGKLSVVFETVKSSVDFTWEGVLHAVARFVTCDNQVSKMRGRLRNWYSHWFSARHWQPQTMRRFGIVLSRWGRRQRHWTCRVHMTWPNTSTMSVSHGWLS